MSNLWASTYDYPASVTKSDTVADPAGPFAGLLVDTGGVLKFTPWTGPLAGSSMTINVVAGQYICFPVQRVWNGTTTAVVVGLVSGIQEQGFRAKGYNT
jgi:hypothetical protein